MTTIQIHDTVGEIVAHQPVLARAFEEAGIDYCCGGKKTLEEACRKKGIDPQTLLAALSKTAASGEEPIVDAATMSLAALADHIEQTHHAYLRSELPRLDALTQKVASVHGENEPRLWQVRKTFIAFCEELWSHMLKEERILFPMVREIEVSAVAPMFHCGSLANPIRQMESEHEHAGSALETLHDLTDGYAPPDWACNSYRAMLDSLARLERDMHQHVHKENNVLFPRALVMEREKAA